MKKKLYLIIGFVVVAMLLGFQSFTNVTASKLNNGLHLLEPTPVPGGPGFYVVNGLSFQPTTGQIEYAVPAFFNPDPVNWRFFSAPVNLPDGVTINKVTTYVLDNDETFGTYITLYRANLLTNVADVLLSYNSEGTQPEPYALSSTNIAYPKVDNQAFQYYVTVQMPVFTSPMKHLVHAVRIDYGYLSNLPVIVK